MPTLSIVAPFLNEAASAPAFAGLLQALETEVSRRHGLAVEKILVDDGSTDGGADILARALSGRWRIIRLSRNFGKEVALHAGIESASGDLVLLLDADLQHSLDVCLKLLDMIVAEPEVDVVYATRTDRREQSLARSRLSKLFYKLINLRQRYELPTDAGDFRVMRRPVAEALARLRDKRRFNKGLYAWAGFRQKALPYTPARREAGASKWSRIQLLALSLEAFTSFSALPLRIMSVTGALLALFGIGYGIKIVLEVLFYGVSVPGYPSLMVAFVVIGGFNLALLGLIGEYVWVALSEAKDRPIYIVRQVMENPATPVGATAGTPDTTAG